MSAEVNVLVLDDEPAVVNLCVAQIRSLGYKAIGTQSVKEALQQVESGACSVVLADVRMPDMEGFSFLQQVLKSQPRAFVVLMTGFHSIDSAIEAIKCGAFDYLTKPLDFNRLRTTLVQIQEHLMGGAQPPSSQITTLGGLIYGSPAMAQLTVAVRRIASHFSNVLITGPTGAGKEVVAKLLHELSPARQGRFAVCNCPAIAGPLMESHLFGHVKGAFTGAVESRVGLFEFANGGTVFLDEIAEIPLPTQAKLLRVIQDRQIQRVGSPNLKNVEVRVIAATNRNLPQEIAANRFREDLFYRLSAVDLRVPPLAQRPEDIPLLAEHFLQKCNQAYSKRIRGFSRRVEALFREYSWPGNVRELENVISAACMVAQGSTIEVSDLPDFFVAGAKHRQRGEESWPVTLRELHKTHVRKVLDLCGGNRSRAAKMLGIGRTSLYRYINEESALSA